MKIMNKLIKIWNSFKYNLDVTLDIWFGIDYKKMWRDEQDSYRKVDELLDRSIELLKEMREDNEGLLRINDVLTEQNNRLKAKLDKQVLTIDSENNVTMKGNINITNKEDE